MEPEPQLATALDGEATVVCAWLFGSVARGTSRADSDVDVGILADLAPEQDRLGWRAELEAKLSRVVSCSST